jgi:hypothetical protein
MNDPKALYKVYADWTGHLHHWVETRLRRHIDCEFFPESWQFKVYSGSAAPIGTRFTFVEGEAVPVSTVPNLTRPAGEEAFTLELPRPENDPSKEQLDEVFRQLCLAAARILEIDLKKHALTDRSQEDA